MEFLGYMVVSLSLLRIHTILFAFKGGAGSDLRLTEIPSASSRITGLKYAQSWHVPPSILPARVYVCHAWTWCPRKPEKGLRFPVIEL